MVGRVPVTVALFVMLAGCTGLGGPATTTDPTTTITTPAPTVTETTTTSTTTTTTIDHEATRQKRDSGPHDYMTVKKVAGCNISYTALLNRSRDGGANDSVATDCPVAEADIGVLPNETNDTFAVRLVNLSAPRQSEFWGAYSGDGKLENPEAWGRYEAGYVYHEGTWYEVRMVYG